MMNNRKPGDWNCASCSHHNFSRRDTCQRCGQPRSAFGAAAVGSEFLPGDWYCCTCGTHNYASRPSCFKCSASKDEAVGNTYGGARSGGGAIVSGWKSGDWLCARPGCNKHNFASRTECFSCNAPKAYGTEF